jgi:hypothetical protein
MDRPSQHIRVRCSIPRRLCSLAVRAHRGEASRVRCSTPSATPCIRIVVLFLSSRCRSPALHRLRLLPSADPGPLGVALDSIKLRLVHASAFGRGQPTQGEPPAWPTHRAKSSRNTPPASRRLEPSRVVRPPAASTRRVSSSVSCAMSAPKCCTSAWMRCTFFSWSCLAIALAVLSASAAVTLGGAVGAVSASSPSSSSAAEPGLATSSSDAVVVALCVSEAIGEHRPPQHAAQRTREVCVASGKQSAKVGHDTAGAGLAGGGMGHGRDRRRGLRQLAS